MRRSARPDTSPRTTFASTISAHTTASTPLGVCSLQLAWLTCSYDISSDSYLKKIEERSGVPFHQLHVALGRLWVGHGEGPEDPTEVSVAIPTGKTLTEQSTSGKKPELKAETYQLPTTIDEAKDIVERWRNAALEIRTDDEVSDNVVQHMLRDRTDLVDEKWLGTEEEERFAYVSELLYIHSKVMIVDDKRVIVSDHHSSRCIRSVLTRVVPRWVLRT